MAALWAELEALLAAMPAQVRACVSRPTERAFLTPPRRRRPPAPQLRAMPLRDYIAAHGGSLDEELQRELLDSVPRAAPPPPAAPAAAPAAARSAAAAVAPTPGPAGATVLRPGRALRRTPPDDAPPAAAPPPAKRPKRPAPPPVPVWGGAAGAGAAAGVVGATPSRAPPQPAAAHPGVASTPVTAARLRPFGGPTATPLVVGGASAGVFVCSRPPAAGETLYSHAGSPVGTYDDGTDGDEWGAAAAPGCAGGGGGGGGSLPRSRLGVPQTPLAAALSSAAAEPGGVEAAVGPALAELPAEMLERLATFIGALVKGRK